MVFDIWLRVNSEGVENLLQDLGFWERPQNGKLVAIEESKACKIPSELIEKVVLEDRLYSSRIKEGEYTHKGAKLRARRDSRWLGPSEFQPKTAILTTYTDVLVVGPGIEEIKETLRLAEEGN